MSGARVLLAGVGYRNLCDYSIGVVAIDRLAERTWGDGVVVEDLSYGPIAVVQRLEDESRDPFGRAVFIAAVARGRTPATVTAYRWDGVLPAVEEIQRAVADAVTGVIHLDNTLIVARHFGALPEQVSVVEVEPMTHEFGDDFSAPIAGIFDGVCDLVTSLASDPAMVTALPVGALGMGLPARLEVS